MNNQEYIIINKTAIQKRIEELEKEKTSNLTQNLVGFANHNEGEISALKQIISQSTPLIPEIEKAFLAGRAVDNMDSIDDMKPTYIQFEDYISNLKLNI